MFQDFYVITIKKYFYKKGMNREIFRSFREGVKS